MVYWSETFWGDGNRGFDVLSRNVKDSALAIEEFQRFLNESTEYAKLCCKGLTRLQSQLYKTQYLGTFTPIWNLIRDLFEKIAVAHSTTVNLYQEILRDIHNYQDLYQKKVKTYIQKDIDIVRTEELIPTLNNAVNSVNKAREQYQSALLDYERGKRYGHGAANTSSSFQDNNSSTSGSTLIGVITGRQPERHGKKCRLAHEAYKNAVENYNAIRADYEKRYSDACIKFQQFEIEHIEKMLNISLTYSDVFQQNQEHITVAHNEFSDKLKSMVGLDLLDMFVEQKKTGTERPAVLQAEEVDIMKAPTMQPSVKVGNLLGESEAINPSEQSEPGVPSFEAHFSVSLPNTKSIDNNRASSNHSQSNNPTVSNVLNSTATLSNTATFHQQMSRSQEVHNSNEQVSSSSDPKMSRRKFPGFLVPGLKNKKTNKNQKRTSSDVKNVRDAHGLQSTDIDLLGSNQEVNKLNTKSDNSDTSVSVSGNLEKFATLDTNTRSNFYLRDDFSQVPHGKDTNKVASSKVSTTTSDTSDDDDDTDNPVVKLDFKINPKADVSAETGDETKIVDAMRLVGQNMNSMLLSRASPSRFPNLKKSASNEHLETRPLPLPPSVPARQISISPNTAAADNFDHSTIFPPHTDFDRSVSQSSTTASINQSKNIAFASSTDDDSEVANSFPNRHLTHTTTLFPNSTISSSHEIDPQHAAWTSASSYVRTSPIASGDIRTSPSNGTNAEPIRLAVAFQEVLHVLICGNKPENWKCRVAGDVIISFPAAMLSLNADGSNLLQFRLRNIDHIENITSNPSLITQYESTDNSNESIYSFDMTELYKNLYSLQAKQQSSPFFNLNVLNYEIKQSTLPNIPIVISSKWTRTLEAVSLKITYRFNSSALPQGFRLKNDTVTFYTIIHDGLAIKESSPNATWSLSEKKLQWNVPYTMNGDGCLSASVFTRQAKTSDDQEENPIETSSVVNACFVGEDALFSPIALELMGYHYRISLLKKKILSGKYQFESDHNEPLRLFQRPDKSPSSNT